MKYIKAILRRLIAFAHCAIIKLFHWNQFQFAIEEMISWRSHFQISGNGTIFLGKRIGIRRNCEFSSGENGIMRLGNDCFFNIGCVVACHESIEIGDNTRFGPYVMIYDHDYDFRNNDFSLRKKHLTSPVVIGKNVWIGGGTTILRGTIIGDDCVIGAGCLIKGVVENGTVVVQTRSTMLKKIERS